LRADLVTQADSPAALAGALLAETVRARAAPPIDRFLAQAGTWTSLSLLTRGAVPDDAITAQADRVLIAPRPDIAGEDMATAFAAANLAAAPYLARAVPPETWTAPDTSGAELPLGDGDWVTLQAICED